MRVKGWRREGEWGSRQALTSPISHAKCPVPWQSNKRKPLGRSFERSWWEKRANALGRARRSESLPTYDGHDLPTTAGTWQHTAGSREIAKDGKRIGGGNISFAPESQARAWQKHSSETRLPKRFMKMQNLLLSRELIHTANVTPLHAVLYDQNNQAYDTKCLDLERLPGLKSASDVNSVRQCLADGRSRISGDL